MSQRKTLKTWSLSIAATVTFALAIPQLAAAHCDTLDGPVVQDARKAIEAKDVTPVLKWVKPKDEQEVASAFNKVLSATTRDREAAQQQFFSTLVKIHREGEGAPFTGLKPAGAVEPAVAEADKALKSGSPDALVHLVTSGVATGIKDRYQRAAAAYKHKDESVARGREFVEAYVELTHYVERIDSDATAGSDAHAGHHGEDECIPARSGHPGRGSTPH